MPVSFEIIISITGFVNILSQFLSSLVESISRLIRVFEIRVLNYYYIILKKRLNAQYCFAYIP